MKTIIFSILATTGAFASQTPSLTSHSTAAIAYDSRPDISFEETPLDKDGFVYIRFSTAEGDLSQASSPHPGLGIGYRRLAGTGAIDISISGIGHREHSSNEFFWTLPKASFIHYFSPFHEKSAYLGGGLAWGGIKRESQKFIGIIPSVVVGYEFLHRTSVLGFAEICVSQPAAAVQSKGAFPGLIGEISIGAGF